MVRWTSATLIIYSSTAGAFFMPSGIFILNLYFSFDVEKVIEK